MQGRKGQHAYSHTFVFFFLLSVERVKAESAQAAAKVLEEITAANFPNLMQIITNRSKKLEKAQAEETRRQLHKGTS